MNTLAETIESAFFSDGEIRIRLQSGREIHFPVHQNPRLSHATPEQLNRIELSPYGLHWPELNEDLSIRGILQGRFGQAATPFI